MLQISLISHVPFRRLLSLAIIFLLFFFFTIHCENQTTNISKRVISKQATCILGIFLFLKIT